MEKSGAIMKKKLVASVLNCSLFGKDSPPMRHSHLLLGRVALVLRALLPLSRAFLRVGARSTIRISAATEIETETEKGSRGTEIVFLNAIVNEKYETGIVTKTESVPQTTAIPSVSKLIESESETVGIGIVTTE
jgi:hypothetical protein